MNAQRKEELSLLLASSAFFVTWFMMTLHQMWRLCTTNTPHVWVLCPRECTYTYASK